MVARESPESLQTRLGVCDSLELALEFELVFRSSNDDDDEESARVIAAA